MSVEKPSEILISFAKTVAKIVGAGIVVGYVGDIAVTALHHRELTHGSIKLHPTLKSVIGFITRIYSPNPDDWAAVHELHHKYPDASLKGIHDIGQAIKSIKKNPERARGVKIPDSYSYLDPFVDSFPREDVEVMSDETERFLRQRLNGNYQPRTEYTNEELEQILNPTEPRYTYPEWPEDIREYTQDQIEEILLGDPHSPVRFPPHVNGVREVLKRNVELYINTSALFQKRPDLKPQNLQSTEQVDHKAVRNKGFVELSLALSAVAFLIGRDYSPKGALKALIEGTAINTVSLGFNIFGGNITNSLGHAGEMTPKGLFNAIFGKEYKFKLNPDGTVSTNSLNGEFIGGLLSKATLDEVGGQDEHHKAPWKIAYTSKTGLAAWREATWGMILGKAAHSRFIPFIKPGKGFGEEETRPDMPSPAVLLIQQRRKEQRIAEQMLKVA